MTSPFSEHFCPYRGLEHYDTEHASFFFGREVDVDVVLANLYTAPLTVLYGESGIGKTSLLAAGVMPQVKPPACAVLFREWQRPDFAAALDAAVRCAVAPALRDRDLPEPGVPLDELVRQCACLLGGPMLLIFDQFEEYFLYHRTSADAESFEGALARAVNRRSVQANFLLSLREEGLSKLDRFQGRIPNLMNNTIRLERLDAETARRAIVEPLERYTKMREAAGLAGVAIEPGLVDSLLSEQVQFEQGGIGAAGSAQRNGPAGEAAALEMPFIQLVLTRLWSAEGAPSAPSLRHETLRRLGGVNGVVRTHLDAAMSRFTLAQRSVAAKMFHYLVTPSRTKIAHTRKDLETFLEASDREAGAIADLVGALSAPDARILKRIEPISNQGEDRFEIFHDVLAAGVLDWRTRFLAGRRLRRRQWEAFGMGLLTLAAIGIWLGVRQYQQHNRTNLASELLAAAAVTYLQTNQNHAEALASEAINTAPTRAAQDAWYRVWVNDRLLGADSVHEFAVRSVAFSGDGQFLLSGSQDKTAGAKIWRADRTGPRLRLSGHRDWVRRAAWGPGDTLVVTASIDSTARTWDARTRTQRHILRSRGVVSDAVFTHDGRYVLTVSEDSTRYIWDAATGAPVHQSNRRSGYLQAVDVAGDLIAASGTGDGGVELWRVPSGESLGWVTRAGYTIQKVRFSPDGSRLAVVGYRRAEIYRIDRVRRPPAKDTLHWVPERVLTGHRRIIFDVAWSPDGQYIATVSRDRTVRVWSANTGLCLLVLYGHEDWVYGVSFSPDGKLLATGSGDGQVYQWALDKLPVRVVSPEATFPASLEPEDRAIVVERGVLVVHSRGRGLRLSPPRESVLAARATPDGHWIVAAGTRTFSLWDRAGKLIQTEPYSRRDHTAGFITSPGTRWLVAAREDGGVGVFDIRGATPSHGAARSNVP